VWWLSLRAGPRMANLWLGSRSLSGRMRRLAMRGGRRMANLWLGASSLSGRMRRLSLRRSAGMAAFELGPRLGNDELELAGPGMVTTATARYRSLAALRV
jgi:hypothetical protein